MEKNWIVICGFPGAGKTTLMEHLRGELLENNPELKFFDLDHSIHQRYELSPKEIIQTKGIEVFRLYELNALRELYKKYGDFNAVISIGGGALNEDSVEFFKEANIVLLWVDTSFEVCLERIRSGPERVMQNWDESELFSLFNERVKYYQLAHLKISGETLYTLNQITDILNQVKKISGS